MRVGPSNVASVSLLILTPMEASSRLIFLTGSEITWGSGVGFSAALVDVSMIEVYAGAASAAGTSFVF